MERTSSIIIKETMNPYAEFLLADEKKKKRKVDDVAFKIPKFTEIVLFRSSTVKISE